MSIPAPIKTGSFLAGTVTLKPGYGYKLDEYGVNVLTLELIGMYTDLAAQLPTRYAALNIGGLNDPNYHCSEVDLIGEEGLTGTGRLEFTGFPGGVPGIGTTEVSSDTVDQQVSWTSFSFDTPLTGPVGVPVISYTIRSASASDPGGGQLGTLGFPTGAPNLPGIIGSYAILGDYSTGFGTAAVTMALAGWPWKCTKDDIKRAGNIWRRTQIWKREYYIILVK